MTNDTKKVFVKPKAGLIVRNPDGNFLPLDANGAWVPPSPYWMRQIADGSVTQGSGPAKAAPARRTTPVNTPPAGKAS